LTLAATMAFATQPSTSSASIPVSVERQEVLIEMRARKILSTTASRWSLEDKALLARMRQAEAEGAINLLKEDLGTLRGYVIMHGSGVDKYLWLTKIGFEKYVFFKSQRARKFFEDQDTDAKFVFELKDTQGEKLFDSKGLLTSAGDELYNRILQGGTVRWIDHSGQETSNSLFLPAPVPKGK